MKMFSFSTLRARLLGLVMLVILPALGLITYTAVEQKREEARAVKQETFRLANLVAASQKQLIEATRNLLAASAKAREVRRQNPRGCQAFLSELLKDYPLYTNFGVATLDGNIFCSALPMSHPVNIADRLYFREAVKAREFAIGEYQIGRITKNPAVNFGYPVINSRGELDSVIYAAMGLKWFEVIASEMNLPAGAVVTLVDHKGIVLARVPDPEGWSAMSVADTTIGKLVLTNKTGTARVVGLGGEKRLYGFTTLQDAPDKGRVFVWVSIPEEVAFAELNQTFTRNLLLLGLITLITLIAAWAGGDVFVLRGVNALLKATEGLAAGNMTARASLSSDKGELGQLGRSFNRMADSLQKRHNELQTLRDIDLSILSTLDLRSVLNILLDKIDQFLPYAAATVRLFNGETGLLEPVACRNLDRAEWESVHWRGGRGIANVVAETKRPLMIRNVQSDPRILDPEFYSKNSLISYLGVPLIAKDEVLGVLGFYTKEEHEFSNEEISFLTILAGQTAIAIHNSQLYENVKGLSERLTSVVKDLEKRTQIQTLLKELSQEITELDIDTLLKRLTETVRAIIRVDICDVWVVQNGKSKIVGISGIEKERMRSERTGAGVGRSRWIVENRKPLIIADTTESTDLQTGSTLRKLGVRGYAGVPLVSRAGQVIGILRALNYSARELTEDEIGLLQQIAAGAAIALENARLFEQTQKQAEELTKSNFELEKANKVKSEFLSVVSHELRTPLNVIIGYTGMVKEGIFGRISGEQMDALNKVTSQSNDMLSMVTEILQATQIEAGEAKLDRSNASINHLLDVLRTAYEIPLKKEIALEWDYPADLPTMLTDRDKVKHILQNLINNAIKFTDAGRITISVREVPEIKSVEFKVTDTGIGIPKEKLPVIFDMFRQGDSSETRLYGGVGLGLFIVKKYTELLGGHIRVESEIGRGSTFTVTIPRAMQMNEVTSPIVDTTGDRASRLRVSSQIK